MMMMNIDNIMIGIKKKLARTVASETVALEIEFFGSCQEFTDRVLPTVRVRNYQGDGCLPISTTGPYDDINDLNTHWFCTRVDRDRSIVHIVEVYNGLTDTPSAEVAPFVISFVPNSPFRALTPKVSLNRRPNCEVGVNYCDPTYGVILGCQTNRVDIRRGYVVNHDRIYLSVGPQVVYECQNAVPSCCAYVSPTLLTTGICPHRGSEDLLSFPREHHDEDRHDEDRHDEDRHDENRPEQHRPEHHEEHRPEHNNNHYENNNHHSFNHEEDDDFKK